MRPFVFLLLAGICSAQSPIENARETARHTLHERGFVSVSDWSRGSSPFCFLSDCLRDASQVPDGTGYFALHGDFSIDPVTFAFPAPADTLSLFASAVGPTTVRALDSAGVEIGSDTVTTVMADEWSTNQLSISAPGIHSIELYANFGIVDQISFDGATETFEDYEPNQDMWLWWDSNLAPQGPFTFDSGLVLTGPLVNIPPPDIQIPEPAGYLLALLAVLGWSVARHPRTGIAFRL